MYLNEIKSTIEEEGYYCTIKNNELYVGQNYKFEEGLGFGTYQKGFSIEIQGKTLTIKYAIGQISTAKEFKTIEELLKFIRQVFPIED
ncbi:hypothetical protein ACM39_15050 [Chryseobacterium sp. FH2]|uniref:hypothetical protein n=1 Tax=Chryseobacterium sp. FH2 TaxID=1674291 RepID=UPI00065A9491|nr:hypothetical protein [Chryseobacterium sp. FH2]KMQ67098.1 hypothetical protein ACM39_15050 [Chryseobacterium sp. FH2]